MREILPGVFHWTATHPKIRIPVSSYWLKDRKVLIDPLVPKEGLDALGDGVDLLLLTNRHHYRDSGAIAKRYGATIRCVAEGMHEFTRGEAVQPFRAGDRLEGDIETIAIGALCPDETALLIPGHGGMVAVADGVVRDGDGPLSFVPDELIGDDPASVKEGLKRSYRRLLEREFDHLLFAHGHPWIGGARKALRDFVES